MTYSTKKFESIKSSQREALFPRKTLGQLFNQYTYLILLAPAFIFYTLFSTVPMLMAIGIGFTEWTGIGVQSIKWVGLENYIELFQDTFFWVSLRNNIVMVAGSVFIGCTMALLLAVILDSGLRGGDIFKTAFFMPTILSYIVVGLLFSLFLSPSMGVFNPILVKIGLADLQHQWLGEKQTALYTIMVINIWKEFGFSMLLFLAGLQSIPKELYESARIDGAGAWNSFLFITIPMLKEVTIVVIILAVNQAFLVFDLIYVMTVGGPYHASEVLSTYMYNRAFTGGRMGYGTAIAEVLFVIVFIATLIQLRVTKAGSTET